MRAVTPEIGSRRPARRSFGAAGARRLEAIECGRIARRALDLDALGTVCAVFRRSCYVELRGGGLVCLGERSLGRGPLNLLPAQYDAPRLGDRLMIAAERAGVWQPERVSGTPAPGALDALQAEARGCVPPEGLGARIAGIASPLIEHAQDALDALDRWLGGGVLESAVERLIGLGPGLTPSGDDYLGGVLVALRAFGNAQAADALWAALGPVVPARTSRISAAHLAAAAEGDGHEVLHDCLRALAAGAAAGWRGRLDRVGAVGHCSGWDALAGALAAIRVERNARIQ